MKKSLTWTLGFVILGLYLFALRPLAVSINGDGRVARGVGCSGAFIDGATVQPPCAGGTSWVTDDLAVYQVCDGKTPSGCRLEEYRVSTGARKTVDTAGANLIAAGGGVWAKWGACKAGPGCGVVTSTGLDMPLAGLVDVGPDGAVAYKDSYQSYGPYHVRELDGTTWLLTNSPAYDVELLGQHRAVYTVAQRPYTIGFPAFPTAVPLIWRPRVVFAGTDTFVCYWTNELGLIMHSVADPTHGWVLRKTPDAFNHDAQLIAPRTIRVAFGLNQGETGYVFTDINVDTTPKVALKAPAPPPPPPPPPPSVAAAAVQVNAFTLTPKANLPDGTVFDLTDPNNPQLGTHVRGWVDGGSIFFSIDYPGAGPNLAGQTHAVRPVR